MVPGEETGKPSFFRLQRWRKRKQAPSLHEGVRLHCINKVLQLEHTDITEVFCVKVIARYCDLVIFISSRYVRRDDFFNFRAYWYEIRTIKKTRHTIKSGKDEIYRRQRDGIPDQIQSQCIHSLVIEAQPPGSVSYWQFWWDMDLSCKSCNVCCVPHNGNYDKHTACCPLAGCILPSPQLSQCPQKWQLWWSPTLRIH